MSDAEENLSVFDRVVLAMGHLALWPTLYTLGVVILVHEMLGRLPNLWILLFAALLTHALYTLDRIKWTNTAWDPADYAADPARHTFLRTRARPVRRVMIAELAACVAIAAVVSPTMLAVELAGAAAVSLYAGAPARSGVRRAKDVSGAKAPMIAGAITLFALECARGTTPILEFTRDLPKPGVLGVLLIVLGDAVLCDLPDRHSDAEHGTKSVPVLVGPRTATVGAMLCLAAGTLAMIVDGGTPLALEARTSIGAMLVASAALAARAPHTRDWVDARLLPIVIYGFWLTR